MGLRRIFFLKMTILSIRILKSKPSRFKKIFLLKEFLADLKKYKKINKNNIFVFSTGNLKPCIFDKTNDTQIDAVCFYQDTWCAKKIFEQKPSHHYDIGSNVEMVGIISQFVPTTMIDIRPINLKLDRFLFIKGNILSLPFENNSLKSISSICVIEHIGLGRYGDKLDPWGSEKAINELKRVLAIDGSLYISLPVNTENIIYFNSHRSFTRDCILSLFQSLKLMEEKYIYKTKMYNNYDPAKGFGTGLFHFKKI